tara:strand:- start:181 stop:570 length:390 start_codon:yes stop_codon:yes gene_type:complete
MFKLSKRSYERLQGVHPDLIEVVELALKYSTIDFGISEGLRNIETQREYVKRGVSTTMNSRHLTGHAIDIYAFIGGSARWEWPLYEEINRAFDKAADELKTDVVWGGDWTSFKDGPHYELSWGSYGRET